MLKRTCTVSVLALALTLGSALIAIPTGAQDQTYYTSRRITSPATP
jgi:hypothetical protein